MPVVDVDRVDVRYRSFIRLIADLRRMGAGNALAGHSGKPLARAGAAVCPGTAR